MVRSVGWTVVLAAMLIPGRAAAQVPWDSPLFLAPNSPPGLGVFIVDYDFRPRDNIGVMAMWRPESGPRGRGYRAGIAEGADEELAIFAGMDFSGPLTRASREFPVDVIWIAGVGGSAGHHVLVSLPVGVALGALVDSDGVWFNPYVSTRVALDATLGDEGQNDDLDLSLGVDVGVDIGFDDARSFVIRFSANLGDRQALAIGINTALSPSRQN